MADKALHRLKVIEAKNRVKRAEKELELAQRTARAHGINYSQIAGWMGQTEAAVRLRFKRKGWDGRGSRT